MEAVDLSKMVAYQGDYLPIPEDYAIGGYSSTAPKDATKAPQPILIVIRKIDGLEISLFANRLRQEGGKLFVSKAHLIRQVKQAELWVQGAAPKK